MNSTISDNTASASVPPLQGSSASASGGGVSNSGIITLTDSIVSGNTVSSNYTSGGGISNGGTVTLTNSTVSGNTTSSHPNSYGYGSTSGGGISNGGTGTVTLTNSTVSGNKASSEDSLKETLYRFSYCKISRLMLLVVLIS
jgi:hypothetical protein